MSETTYTIDTGRGTAVEVTDRTEATANAEDGLRVTAETRQ